MGANASERDNNKRHDVVLQHTLFFPAIIIHCLVCAHVQLKVKLNLICGCRHFKCITMQSKTSGSISLSSSFTASNEPFLLLLYISSLSVLLSASDSLNHCIFGIYGQVPYSLTE